MLIETKNEVTKHYWEKAQSHNIICNNKLVTNHVQEQKVPKTLCLVQTNRVARRASYWSQLLQLPMQKLSTHPSERNSEISMCSSPSNALELLLWYLQSWRVVEHLDQNYKLDLLSLHHYQHVVEAVLEPFLLKCSFLSLLQCCFGEGL